MNSLKEIAASVIIKQWITSRTKIKLILTGVKPIPLDIFRYLVQILVLKYSLHYSNCFTVSELTVKQLTNIRLSPSGNYAWIELNDDGKSRLISVVDYVQKGFNLKKSTTAVGILPKARTHRLYQRYLQQHDDIHATRMIRRQYMPVISPFDNFTLYLDPMDNKYYLDDFNKTPSAQLLSDKADMHYVINDQFIVLKSNPYNGTPSYLYQWILTGLKLVGPINSQSFHIICLLNSLGDNLTLKLAKMLIDDRVAKVLIEVLKLPRNGNFNTRHIFKLSPTTNYLLTYTIYSNTLRISFSALINLQLLFQDALNDQVASTTSYVLPYPRGAMRTAIWDTRKDRLIFVGPYHGNGKPFIVRYNPKRNRYINCIIYPDLGHIYPINLITQKTVLSLDHNRRYLAVARHIGNTIVWIYGLPGMKVKYLLQLEFGTFKFHQNWALINIPIISRKAKIVIKDGNGAILKQQMVRNGLHLLNFETLVINILIPPLWNCNALERITYPGHFTHYFKFGPNRIISKFNKTKYIIDYRCGVLSNLLGIPNLPPLLTDQQYDQLVTEYYYYNSKGKQSS